MTQDLLPNMGRTSRAQSQAISQMRHQNWLWKPQAFGTDVCTHVKPQIQSETFDEPANPGRSNNNNPPCPRHHDEQTDNSRTRVLTFYS